LVVFHWRQRGIRDAPAPIGLRPAAGGHRRDHVHEDGQVCHPHVVEVIGLGHSAMVVCHDCARDTGFMVAKRAEEVALRHRRLTA
jgi:hypothetical protein